MQSRRIGDCNGYNMAWLKQYMACTENEVVMMREPDVVRGCGGAGVVLISMTTIESGR